MDTVLVIFLFLLMDNTPCPPLASPPFPPYLKFLISIVEYKNLNANYVEFDVSRSAVLVIFSFFWMDNAPYPSPWSPPICKIFNIHHRKTKLNENYVKFYFSMGIVLVIFSFFWTDNDLVYAPPSPGSVSLYPNYAHTLAHIPKTTRTIFLKLLEVVSNNIRVTNLH